MSAQTVLITGGRAPVALDLARKFYQKGWRVVVAESIPFHLCRGSRAISASYRVPPPRQEPEAFVTALVDIIQREGVDWLIPTCEEIFTIALHRDRLTRYCHVLVERSERILALHSKWDFIRLAREFGLAVPETHLLEPGLEATSYIGRRVVLKPEFSRFATSAIILPIHLADIQPLQGSNQRWVAQEYVQGRQLCSYSVVHAGNITAHAVYETRITAGQGATIAFEPLEHPAVMDWVHTFVSCYGFTGQIAFDFIETASGDIYAIECNPRAISGIHLLNHELVDALTNLRQGTHLPMLHTRRAVWLAVLFFGWQRAPSWNHWIHTLRNSRDVVFSLRDPVPFFEQFLMFLYMLGVCFTARRSLIEATTYDIEWNQPFEAERT